MVQDVIKLGVMVSFAKNNERATALNELSNSANAPITVINRENPGNIVHPVTPVAP